MKNLKALLCVALLMLQPALAAPPAIPPSAPGVLPDAAGNMPSSYLNYAQPRYNVVCSNGVNNTSNTSSANSNWSTSLFVSCPKGATSIQLELSGVVMPTPAEIALPSPFPYNLSFVVAPAPWSASTTYAIGNCVTYYSLYDGAQFNPQWCAAISNTNSPPSPTNVNWTAGVAPTKTLITCSGGSPNCMVPTAVGASGVTQQVGTFLTDAIPVQGCGAPCYIRIYSYQYLIGGTSIAASSTFVPANGDYLLQNGADVTASGFAVIDKTYSSGWRPQAILGTPATPTPSVCIIGDSIAFGYDDAAVANISSFTGGTGYSVGDLLTISNTGASAFAVAQTAQFKVLQVDGSGVILTMVVADPGGYTVPAVTGGTLPSGAQTVSGGTGTGATITPSFTNTGGQAVADSTGARGNLARALAIAGVPNTKFAVSGDTLSNWVTARSYTRVQNVIRSGCSSAIIALGINDVRTGASAATMQSQYLTLAGTLKAGGVKGVYFETMSSQSLSTNGFQDQVNQTVSANDNVRIAVNTWMLAGVVGITGVLDRTLVSESVPNSSGKWVSNGTICYATCTEVHMSPAMQALVANSEAAQIAAMGGFK